MAFCYCFAHSVFIALKSTTRRKAQGTRRLQQLVRIWSSECGNLQLRHIGGVGVEVSLAVCVCVIENHLNGLTVDFSLATAAVN